MSGRIPQAFLDELLNRVDIVEVIERRVPLKAQGRNFTARCPFHEERTPSFSVNREKQFYHCFGCRKSGTAITFLMEYDGLDFLDAVEDLASLVGLEVPRERRAPDAAGAASASELDAILNALERANRHYQRQLREHAGRERAVDYLKSRGLSGAIAKEFEIGFAPPGWEGVRKALEDMEPKVLERAGLVIRREEGTHYDRFRDRIMFPIRDRRGRVVGFGGRTIGDDEPKYLNSPDGPLFHKGRELYALHRATGARAAGGPARRPERLVVVEGYMDVVALAEAGIDNAVATLGTAATREHLQQLYRPVSEVVFCFDGDTAGRSAAWRALEQALPMLRDGRGARFLLLPEGEDPDSFVRARGAEAFNAAVEEATPLSEFLFSTLLADTDTNTLEARARLVERATALIAQVPTGAFRTLLRQRAAELGQVKEEEIDALIANAARSGRRNIGPAQDDQGSRPAATITTGGLRSGSGRTPSLVQQTIHLLLHRPALIKGVNDLGQRLEMLEHLNMKGAELLVDLLRAADTEPPPTTAALVERYRDDTAGPHLVRLVGESFLIQTDEGIEAEFTGALQKLRNQALRQRRRELLERERTQPLSDAEKQEYLRLLAERDDARASAPPPDDNPESSPEPEAR